jgi:hypothetical protein
MSRPVALPDGPTAAPKAKVVSPKPQPTSRTCSPGCGCAASRSTGTNGASMRRKKSAMDVQRVPPSAFQ